MFHEYVKLLIKNSRRISDENLVFTGNVRELSYGFPREYKGLEVKTGFGKGNWADVTWIGFLSEGQTIQKGIYPVYLYYRNVDVLILAYGISETYTPDIKWPISNVQNIRDYFQQNGWRARRYKESFVYKAYTSEDIENITENFDKDLNNLINTYKEIMGDSTSENSDSDNPNQDKEQNARKPIQTIYFGSPGTGKSFKIKNEVLSGVHDDYIFRTTFHPDADYASFVGCYKPIANKGRQSNRTYTVEELAEIYKREVGPTEDLKTSHIEPRIQFGIEYCEYFGGSEANYDANKMLELAGIEHATGCQEDRVGITYLKYGINIGLKMGIAKNNSIITYDFVPQAFTNAYVKSWQDTTESVFLVIEEINRGNCAQIFGDLFQLLDRNDDGVSEYPIKADADLAKHLQEKLGPDHEGIAKGEIKLPGNLNIIATMNTSDQSLFPMDSAFKRRWEWKYVPTKVTPERKEPSAKETVVLIEDKIEDKDNILVNHDFKNRTIDFGAHEYNWSDFLRAINKRIREATKSDDKLLGYWFAKGDQNGNISISTFVSKVIFYLWNDVFKEYGTRDMNPFCITAKDDKGQKYKTIMSFNQFFDENTGEINIGVVHTFMGNIGLIPQVNEEVQKDQDQRQEIE